MDSNKFSPMWCGKYDANYNTVDAWKIQKYLGRGTASSCESHQTWDTKAEAQAAADRANAGNEEGLTFGCYADD